MSEAAGSVDVVFDGVGSEVGLAAFGVPYRDRAARTDAALGILRGLIAGKPTGFPGGTELTLAPGAPPPPIWVGGGGAASRRRAAAYGDGWFPSMITPDGVSAGAAHLAGLWAGQGRAGTPAVAVGGSVLLGAATPGDAPLFWTCWYSLRLAWVHAG